MGSYTVLGRIGEGGMGAVYLGRSPDGRQVAIKVVRPELALDSAFVARFQEEVNNAKRVASFCTAQVLDHGESGGRAYMVTEYIDGISLKDYVKQNGELSPGMLQGVAVGVAAALAAIHAAGLIHRDLKPANVMLSFSGPRVIDFGIARALDAASGLTMTGQLVGSPGWIAPERILQQQVTTAADVFSWGCLVGFASNGVNPFGTGDFSVMSARLLHGDPQLGDLPAPLDRLVRAALDKDPRNRPTARELLLTMVGGESSEAAVLGTLTGWQAPVPLLPYGRTRVLEEPTGSPGPVAGRTEAVAHPATVAASSSVESPTVPSGPGIRPPAPPGMSRPRPERGGRKALVAGAIAIVLAVAAVGGWLALRPGDDGHPSTQKTASGPAPLPKDQLLVRVDRKPGWPSHCYGSVGTLTPSTTAVSRVIDDGTVCDILPRWSPNRRMIAFTRSTSLAHNELWVANADGSGTPRMITDRVEGRSRVAWSPDGKRIAIVDKPGTSPQISVVAVDAPQSIVQLTNTETDKDDPAWCGDHVAFWSKSDGGTQQVYTVDVKHPGSAPTQVTHADHDVNDPAFSPNCKYVAYTDQPNTAERHIWITTCDGKGGPGRQLTPNATRDMDATFSRDGKWIAVARGTTAEPSVWAMRVDGTDARQLSPKDQYMAHPDWS